MEQLNKAISIHPRAPELYFNLGFVDLAQQRFADSEPALRHALISARSLRAARCCLAWF